MKIRKNLVLITALLLALIPAAPQEAIAENAKARYHIVTSDTLLSGMAEALLPGTRYRVKAILPPGQCPGHYDVKLADIEEVQKADLVISFRGMPFMKGASFDDQKKLEMDNGARNWMVPDSYIDGMNHLANHLSVRFPADRDEIGRRNEAAVLLIRKESVKLRDRITLAGLRGLAVLASSLQKETLEWMGLRVVGVYGRPESISARDVVRLIRIGREQQALAVVDNLQSGPDAGIRIAEALGRPHIVLNNFPSERGYLSTLKENVEAVMAATGRK